MRQTGDSKALDEINTKQGVGTGSRPTAAFVAFQGFNRDSAAPGGFRVSLRDELTVKAGRETFRKFHMSKTFAGRLEEDQRIREKILNQIIMNENRQKHGLRSVRRPRPYFAALVNEFGEPYDEVDMEKPDYFIRDERDIDKEGLFAKQRIL